MIPFSVHTPKKRKERNTCIFRVSLLHVKQAQLINPVIYLKAMTVLDQSKWLENWKFVWKMVILAGHSPLTGHYFESWFQKLLFQAVTLKQMVRQVPKKVNLQLALQAVASTQWFCYLCVLHPWHHTSKMKILIYTYWKLAEPRQFKQLQNTAPQALIDDANNYLNRYVTVQHCSFGKPGFLDPRSSTLKTRS